jgi:hypothetical protein
MNIARVMLASAVAVASATAAAPAAAQNFLLPSGGEKGVAIEVAHPKFKAFDTAAGSSVWYLSGGLPITSRLRLVADVPFAHARLKDAGASPEGWSSVLGNPLLGVEYLAAPGVRIEVTTRAPLTTADEGSFADAIGLVSDLMRSEAFGIDVVPLSARVSVVRALGPGFDVQARGGLTTAYHKVASSWDTDTAMEYSIFSSYSIGIARVGAGMAGRWHATAEEGALSDNAMHQAGFTADVQLAGFRPGIALRLPVDKNYREVMGSAVGMYVQLPLR